MSSHQQNRNVIANKSTFSHRGRVDLVEKDFYDLVNQKGYNLWIDRSIKCPCASKNNNQALVNCKNCGGSGWVYFNREEVKGVVQSMNTDTKFKDWSQEDIGNGRATILHHTALSFMDRLILTNSYAVHKQLTHCIIDTSDNNLKAKLIYNPLVIFEIFMFVDENSALTRLELNTHFTVQDNIITLNDSFKASHSENQPITLSIRYKHNPTYHVIDIPRDNIASYTKKGRSAEKNQVFPIHCVVRKSHYVLDEQNYGTEWLNNNNYQYIEPVYVADEQ